jgi:Zn-finger nucleic acid-binding protein
MFDGAIYCPSCGARRPPDAGRGPRQAPCPHCRNVMHERTVADGTLLECEKCHGMWIDTGAFERLCRNREAQATVLTQGQDLKPPPGAAGVHYRHCVACNKIMNRVNFGRVSGTIIDVCKGHGAFFDAGELHAVVNFVQNGGYDRMRAQQIQDMKDEEDRLRSLMNQLTRGNSDL